METNPLLPVRRRIDEIDRQLLPLFIERMHCSEEVARIKQREGIPILNPVREAEILEQLRQSSEEYGEYAKELYTKIFALSRERQHRMLDNGLGFARIAEKAVDALPAGAVLVACQGAAGAYAHQAAGKMFPDMPVSFHSSWEDVCAAVSSGRADFGVLPIENSSAGSVTDVYDLLIKNKFSIAKATTVRVQHCLAALCPQEQVKKVISHPQALAQCDDYIRRHGYASEPFSNTAAAAKHIAETAMQGTAAICSKDAAETYGLQILDENIQDAERNRTRFIAISRTLYLTPDANKISMCFDIPHVAGSLYGVLERIALHNMNMTKIESRPVPNGQREPFEYHFYLDCSGNVADPDTQLLLGSFAAELPNFTFFGNYAES